MRKTIPTAIISYFFLLLSCNTNFRSTSVEYKNYDIHPVGNTNSPISAMIKPYSDSINMSMNDVVGENDALLEKAMKKNSLGYFMTDAFLFIAKEKFKTEVDIAFLNYGGIRLNELTSGKITKGKIFELMPFENLLLLQKIKGKILKQYLDSTGYSGSLVISGLTMNILKGKPENIKIGGKAFDENADYVITISDYMVNSSELLKTIPVLNIGYLQRDAIIEYVSVLTQKGKKIVVENLNRVNYAE